MRLGKGASGITKTSQTIAAQLAGPQISTCNQQQ